MHNTFSDSPRVLIADDSPVMRGMLRQFLEKNNYTVDEAVDGDEVVALMQEKTPELVLLDAKMPKMDGFTACEDLRSIPEFANIPVVMVTALEDDWAVDRAFAAGADEYITKPLHWAVMRHRIYQMVSRARAEKNN